MNDIAKKLESNLIGTLITYPEKIVKIAGKLSQEDFYWEKAGEAFGIILESVVKKQDTVSRLDNISEFLHTDFRDVEVIADEVKRMSTARKIKNLLIRYQNIDYRSLEETIPRFITEFIGTSKLNQKERTNIKDIIHDYEAEQERHRNKDKKYIGMECGFPTLDGIIDGIRPGHFWVVGGYTSMGKTFFVLNILKTLLEQGKRCVFFSLEMSRQDILGRLIGLDAKINSIRALKSILSESEAIRVEEAKGKLYDTKLEVYNDKTDLDSIYLTMLEENMKEPVDCFFLDYMQLLSGTNKESDYEVLRRASKLFQSFGRSKGIPIVALSQISNEAAKNKSDTLIGFKGSGDIANSADIAIELGVVESKEDRELKKSQGLALNVDCVVKKNRHGITGTIEMNFDPKTGTFQEGRESTINSLMYKKA